MMKNRIRKGVVFLFILSLFSTVQAKPVRLYGSLKVLKKEKVTMNFEGSASEIYNNRDLEIPVKENGEFECVFDLDKPAFYKLGQNLLYLTPGDQIEITIARAADGTIFRGKGSDINNYLKGSGWNASSNLGFSWGGLPTLGKVYQKMDSLLQIRRGELAMLKGKIPKDYQGLAETRLVADQIKVHFGNIYLTEYYKWDDTPDVKEEKKKDYYCSLSGVVEPLLRQIDRNEKFLEEPVVREVLLECYQSGCFDMHVTTRLRELVKILEVSEEMDRGIMKDKLSFFQKFGQQIRKVDWRESFDAKLTVRTSFMEGCPALDIILRDTLGKISRLSDHKGKPLFVDFWATWCLPCLAQAPHLKLLSEEYPDVQFIAISVDQSEETWKKKLQKDGEHESILEYIADVIEVGKAWDLSTIPRFLMIDEEFNIITAFAPRPSEKKEVESLLKRYK